MAHIIESAIGKSYPEPSLRLEAGARFMTMCFAGKRKPVFFMAERMRSFASLTAASGQPTISNAGKPFEISVSTHTENPSIPESPQEYMCESIYITSSS